MTTIFLHGYLRDLHPEPIRVEANSAAEALSSLQLVPTIAGRGNRHFVRVEGFGSRDALYDRREIDELHIHPLDEEEKLMIGSGRAGVTQIVIGALIIATAIYTGGIGSVTMGQMLFAGGMMVLGGVLQLLAPQPKLDSNERSKYLGAGKNTVAIGTRIPLIYGRCKAYGHYISFNVDAGNFNTTPDSWYSSPYTDYGTLNYSAVSPNIPIQNPQDQDQNPVSTYRGLAYPANATVQSDTYIKFDSVTLLTGEYDLNFANGKTLHVSVATAGSVSQATLLGGTTNDMPSIGTSIVFTRNYG